MEDDSGVTDGPGLSSPWPMFVAFGLAIGEVGVMVPILPLAVGGLLLFAFSVAGILRETAYVTDIWTTFASIGAVFVVLGVALYVYTGAPLSVEQVTHTLEQGSRQIGIASIAYRGLLLVVTGAFATVLALVGRVSLVQRGEHPGSV
jgi:hypothetical protein